MREKTRTHKYRDLLEGWTLRGMWPRFGEGDMSTAEDKMKMALETAREIANVQWRVEKGGRYSVASQNIAGIIRGTIMTLASDWERSQGEIARLQAENESLKGEVAEAWIASVSARNEVK